MEKILNVILWYGSDVVGVVCL